MNDVAHVFQMILLNLFPDEIADSHPFTLGIGQSLLDSTMAEEPLANEFRKGSYRCTGCNAVLYSYVSHS